VTGLVSVAVHLYSLRTILFAGPKFPEFRTALSLVKDGVPFVSLAIFTTLYGQSDPFILHLLTNEQTVGWYSVALKLVGTTMFVPVAINSALTPTLSRLYSRDAVQFRNLARRMLSLSATCAVPVALILLFGARPILEFLYSSQFDGSVLVLQIGGGASFLYYMTVIFGTVIVASDRQKHLLGIFAKSLLIGVPSCFILTHLGHRFYGNGAAGAILSDTLMETYIFTALASILKDIFPLREIMRLIGRLTLAAIPMILLLLWISVTNLPVTALGGLAVLIGGLVLYVLGGLLLHCIDVTDYLNLLRTIVRQRSSTTTS
jgi:O-antigen/teichoic acid export membrane protein